MPTRLLSEVWLLSLLHLPSCTVAALAPRWFNLGSTSGPPRGCCPSAHEPPCDSQPWLGPSTAAAGTAPVKTTHDDLGDGTSATSIDPASMDGEERGTAPNRAATREPRHPPAAARETRQPAAAGRSLPALSFFCTQKEMRH